jgi:hypothetical protein
VGVGLAVVVAVGVGEIGPEMGPETETSAVAEKTSLVATIVIKRKGRISKNE